jgi:glycine amidinotransferase/scyllo-inosamine-4-phosphate amidinotransferase 1
MRINSNNEWGKLKSVVVGSATNANWPSDDPVFAEESRKTTWTETPVPSGAVPQWIIDEANEDLAILIDTLHKLRIDVYQPKDLDFPRLGGMYNYCPRDRFIIAGKNVIDPAMMYPCREMESSALSFILDATEHYIKMPRNQGMVLDAANVCRMNDRWLFLESPSGNRQAYEWLCQQLPDIKIELCNFYAGVHIDSTIAPLREGLVMLNASRVNQANCPKAFDGWEKIWVQDVIAQDFYQYPYASKWVGMNVLSIDEHTVIIDAAQTQLIKDLERVGITSIPLTLRHSRTLGGSFHCVTLDLVRE